MRTWHCTTQGRHLPHTWFYRNEQRWYRCDGQDLRVLRNEEQPMLMNQKVEAGTEIVMTGTMPNDPDPMPVGAKGTVIQVIDGHGNPDQILVAWDPETAGTRSLILLGSDPFAVVKPTEATP
jgi:hypothetical protein